MTEVYDSDNDMRPWVTGIPNQSSHMRARGNIGYIDFIRAVEHIWSESHPDIPMYAVGLETYASYPCIVYSLDRRITYRDETKPRQREMILTPEGEKGISVFGQRFDNLVSFTALTKNDAQLAEQLIETFEDFLLEFTPVLKQIGVSEMVYHQRMADGGESRTNTDVVKRRLVYRIILEKVITRDWHKLNEVLFTLRTIFSPATPESEPPLSIPTHIE